MAKRQSKLGIAVIGCGDVSRGHIKSWQAHAARATVVGFYDPVTAFAEERRTQFKLGQATIYDSYEQALDDPAVDIINLCSMSDVHDAQIMAAMDAGKHIMTEKPTGYTMEGCRHLRWYVRKYPHLKVGVAYSLRYYPINIAVRKLIQSGDIGEPMWAHIEHNHQGHAHPPGTDRADWGISNLSDRGGRYIPGSDMCHPTHPYDLSRYMLGEPIEVYATRNASGLYATIRFNSEAVAQVSGGSVSAKGLRQVCPVMIQGTEGTIYTEQVEKVRGQQPEIVAYHMSKSRKGGKIHRITAPNVNLHGDDVRAANFMEALLEDRPLICELADSIRTSELLHAIWNSLSLGIRVPIQRCERTG